MKKNAKRLTLCRETLWAMAGRQPIGVGLPEMAAVQGGFGTFSATRLKEDCCVGTH